METIAHHALMALTILAMAGSLFGALALVLKRRAIGKALMRVHGEFTTNLALMLFNVVLLAPLFAMPEGFIRNHIAVMPAMMAFWSNSYDVIVVAVTVLVSDFVVYWRHRAEHHPMLWPIHATHHADTALHWLSVQRKHPLSKLFSVLIDVWILFLIGFPEWAIATAGVLRSWWAFFIHADVPWTLGLGQGNDFTSRASAPPYSRRSADGGQLWQYGHAVGSAFRNLSGPGTPSELRDGHRGRYAGLSR